jgi:hypothetical protein
MRKFLFLTFLLLGAAFAGAAPHDVVVTSDGTLFTIETASADPSYGEEVRPLLLTIRRGEDTWEHYVPATLDRGQHVNAALAYDADSETLFVIWIRYLGLMYNELVFASRDRDGTWSAPTSFGNPYDFRQNLRIAVTRKVTTTAETEGEEPSVIPGLTVHAVWWQFDSLSGGEATHYAMLTLDKGAVASVDYLDLADLVDRPAPDSEAAAESANEEPAINPASLEVLRHPHIFTAPDRNSVLLVFGDFESGRLSRARVFPTKPPQSDVRIRIPIGRGEGGSPAPRLVVNSQDRIEGIYDSGVFALLRNDTKWMEYVILRDGVWTEPRSIAINTGITRETAVSGIRRLASEQ